MRTSRENPPRRPTRTSSPAAVHAGLRGKDDAARRRSWVPFGGGPAVTVQAQHHPVVIRLSRERAEDFQLRIADRITAFAGSMWFVYIHVILFAAWMLIFEKSPWPTLTLIVSLEAIFLSTFVM